jgi:hypothetical protein
MDHTKNDNFPTENEEEEKFFICPQIEFDAPRYTNFSSAKFVETRKLLNKIVLDKDDDEGNEDEAVSSSPKNEDEDEEFEKEFKKFFDDYSSDADMDEWFSRFHPLHEPLRPMTPPGPLISPEKTAVFNNNGYNPERFITNSNKFSSLKASPLKLLPANSSSTASSPFKSKSPFKSPKPPNNFLNTPSKGPNTRIGLRAKPARILKPSIDGGGSGGSLNSSPTKTFTSSNNFNDSNNFTFNSNSNLIPTNHSPLRSKMTTMESNQSSPTPLTPKRLSSASDSSFASLKVSSLTKSSFLVNNNSNIKNSTTNYHQDNINSSPLKMKFSGGTASPLSKAVGILQLQNDDTILQSPPPQQQHLLRKKRSSPSESSENSLNKKFLDKRPRAQQSELEDIKKLLSQHNSRLRPNHNNNNNNNNNNGNKPKK